VALENAVKAVMDTAQQVIQKGSDEPSVEKSRDPLYFLSEDSKALANTALAVATASFDSSYKAVSETLAVQFGLPARQLSRKLMGAVSELNDFIAATESSPPPMATFKVSSRQADAPEAIPPLLQKIRFPDDPNKGRFGEMALREGFSLDARFAVTKSRNWATIWLTVTCPPNSGLDGQSVVFVLHDSFKPFLHSVPFDQGKAELKVTAWGGFTVGAWIAAQECRLELDLALLPDAPNIIQTR
jgi:hypothetical protein